MDWYSHSYHNGTQNFYESDKKITKNNHSPSINSTIQGSSNYPAHNEFFINSMSNQQQEQQISQFNLNMKKLYSQEQISFYKEKSISNIIEFMEKLNIKCLQKQEIAIAILSYIIPYTPEIQEFSNFIIAFSINQSCFPTQNKFSLSMNISYLNEGVIEYKECIEIYSCFVQQLREKDNITSIQKFDKMHSYLLSLILSSDKNQIDETYPSYNELQFRITPSNTTFAHLSKITEGIKMSEEDYETIKDLIEIYWIHEELFNYYPGEMCANAILYILDQLNCTDADLSALGGIYLLQQVHSVQWLQQYKQFCQDLVRISQIDMPQDLNMDVELNEQKSVENQNITINENKQELRKIYNQNYQLQNCSDHNQEIIKLEDLNIDLISIQNNDKDNTIFSKFKQNNANQDEKIQNLQNQNQNPLVNDYIMTTPDKRTQAVINQSNSPLFTGSLGKQNSDSIFHTGETKSSSVSNISINTDSQKNMNLKPFFIKNPSPFNPQLSTYSQ